ncbi:Fic family protein [Massilia orientalis]|uniref:Fic family protein n=1 Tax=Massilia orientalis TaxID=3050128 RepID=A0ACC7MJT3_9BURK|nr:Fic family protein [Massilia sp. YIM B02787]
MFHGLTPDNCRYLAGNYRGSAFPCLRDYKVGVLGDRRVGTPPHNVAFEMQLFEAQLQLVIKAFAQDVQKAGKFDQKLLLAFIDILAKFLVYFFAIHPYANGNGHSGRLMVLVLLKRFNLDPKSWPLDQSPSYGDAIRAHRDGKPGLLRNFILDRILN